MSDPNLSAGSAASPNVSPMSQPGIPGPVFIGQPGQTGQAGAQAGSGNPLDLQNQWLFSAKPYPYSDFELYVGEQAQLLARRAKPTARQLQQAQAQAWAQAQAQAQMQRQQSGFGPQQPMPVMAPDPELIGAVDIRRFGSQLVTDSELALSLGASAADPLAAIPGDYIIKPGDQILVALSGSVDGQLALRVDRSGKITIPRVGGVQVGGRTAAALEELIRKQVAQSFRNFSVTASVGQVQPVRVFVTGYAHRPGSLTVSGLATVLHALIRAGGPSEAGSYRNIELRRGGQAPARIDLYDFLLKGDRQAERILMPDDVIHIGPAGTQVGVIGNVNQQAVFELKDGETLQDALRMAGGFNAVADRSRVSLEKLADRTTGRVEEVALPSGASTVLGTGDVIRAFSAVSAALPMERQRKRVRIEGEVARPGDYVLAPGTTLQDALAAAGGMTPAAYVFGTEFNRESVRLAQQENYDKALRDLETELTRAQSTQRVSSTEEATKQTAMAAGNARLIEQLRRVRPTGRIVLQLEPGAQALPNLPLEDGDRISIPARASSVGVYGSVFSTGSFLHENGRSVVDYVQQAGGPTKGADAGSMFVMRANGSVVSARQGAGWLSSGSSFARAEALPGDTIFVPEEIDKTTFTQNLKDWTQILYQFGMGVAGLKALGL